MNNAAVNISTSRCFSVDAFLCTWDWDCWVAWCLANVLRSWHNCFPKWLPHFTSLPAIEEDSGFSTSSPKSVFGSFFVLFSSVFHNSHPNGCEVPFYCGSDLHLPNNQWCWASFHMLIGHLYIFLGEISSDSLAGLKLSCLFYYCVVRVLYIFWIQVSYLIYKLPLFSLSFVGWILTFFMKLFAEQKFLILMKFILSSCSFVLFVYFWWLVPCLRNHCSTKAVKMYSYVFF